MIDVYLRTGHTWWYDWCLPAHWAHLMIWLMFTCALVTPDDMIDVYLHTGHTWNIYVPNYVVCQWMTEDEKWISMNLSNQPRWGLEPATRPDYQSPKKLFLLLFKLLFHAFMALIVQIVCTYPSVQFHLWELIIIFSRWQHSHKHSNMTAPIDRYLLSQFWRMKVALT